MADNPKKTAEEVEQMETDGVEQSGGTFRSILKIFGIFLALAGIILAGFFAGIYLRVLDVYEMNEKLDLYAMPFIGEYFVEPMKKTPGVLDEYIFQPINFRRRRRKRLRPTGSRSPRTARRTTRRATRKTRRRTIRSRNSRSRKRKRKKPSLRR